MIPYRFEYFRPKSWREAVDLLSQHGDSVKILAGGQSMLPLMKLRILRPDFIVDVSRIEGSSYIEESENGETRIGALATHRSVEESEFLRSKYTLLSDAAASIGDMQVRSWGTIGGSVCHADPGGSYSPPVLALDATMVVEGENGERTLSAREFFLDAFTTALGSSDVLTEIRLPRLPPRTGSSFLKYSMRPQDFAIVTIAAVATVDRRGRVQKAAISLGGIQTAPLRLTKAEEAIQGKTLDESLEKVVAIVDDIEVTLSDHHASAEYRKEMAKAHMPEVLSRCVTRAESETTP